MRDIKGINPEEAVHILSQKRWFKTDIKCSDCDGYLVVREGYSKFLGCSNYPKCNSKYGIMQGSCYDAPLPRIAFSIDDETWEDVMSEYPLNIMCADDIKMN